MKTASMSADRLAELVEGFPAARIGILGDFYLDKYFELDPALEKVSVETGKPAHQVTRIRHSPGCAGTIVNNLISLGCKDLKILGFSGDDGDGYELRRDLAELGCDITHFHKFRNRITPVYLKPRNQSDPTLHAEQARFDIENRSPTPEDIEDALIASIDAVLDEIQALVIMDQLSSSDCGVITRRVRQAIADRALANPDTVFWADSRRFIRTFRNVIIKPNPYELLGIRNPPPGSPFDLNLLLEKACEVRRTHKTPLVITRGGEGMWVSDPEWISIPGVPVDGPVDPTGAGDSATAGAIAALCSGASLPEAAIIGNLVASITVQQVGTTGTARVDQLEAARTAWANSMGTPGHRSIQSSDHRFGTRQVSRD